MSLDHSREAYLAHIRSLEETGELYPLNVQINFPPQVKTRFNRDGLIIPVSQVLELLAQDLEAECAVSSAELRAISAEFYVPYDDEDEEEDDEDDAASHDADLLTTLDEMVRRGELK